MADPVLTQTSWTNRSTAAFISSFCSGVIHGLAGTEIEVVGKGVDAGVTDSCDDDDDGSGVSSSTNDGVVSLDSASAAAAVGDGGCCSSTDVGPPGVDAKYRLRSSLEGG